MASKILNVVSTIKSNDRWRYAPSYMKSIEGAWLLSRSVMSIKEAQDRFLKSGGGERLTSQRFYNALNLFSERLPADPYLALAQLESQRYMMNQLIRDADWAGMAHGVEIRLPLVDMKLSQALSPYFKQMKKFRKKELLVSVPEVRIPDFIAGRKKTGFAIPVDMWMTGFERSTHTRRWQEFIMDSGRF